MSLGERRGDPALRLAGLNAAGFTLLMMGELAQARTHLEDALAAHETMVYARPSAAFVHDPAAETSLTLALTAWLVGEPRQARQLCERASALAVANRNPLSEVAALWVAAMLHAMAEEFDAVLAFTERLYGVIRDQEVPEGRSGFAWLHGRALVALGRVDGGLAEMRSAMLSTKALGMRFGLCEFHYHYAQACRAAGLNADARASIEAGLALAQDGEEKMMLSPLLQQLALAQAAEGDAPAAAETIARAVETARTQGAVFHELVALASAQRLGFDAADPIRLEQLLQCYADDASPVIAAARSLVS